MSQRVSRTVTLLPGDGIGPEVVAATRRVVDACDLGIEWEECRAGREVFASGDPTGVPSATVESIQRNRVALKGPLETPIGHGGNSANVTLRKMFETFGNIRPARTIPGVKTPFSDRKIDMVVVRENVEDLYAGIEHMQTRTVAQCLKLVSELGCEKIARLAFEVARSQGRGSVTCVTKANIMKLTEGMLKRVFAEVAKDYPTIEPRYMLVDNCAHQLVRVPEEFEVIVTTNMNGDIISDLVSGLVGGLGIAPGANLGLHACIFEAVHGTAPDIAGKGLANPTATLLSAVMMLRHFGSFDAADRIEAAVALTLEQGPHTGDLARRGQGVGTQRYTDAILDNLGKEPEGWVRRQHLPLELPDIEFQPSHAEPGRNAGVDLFIESERDATEIGERLHLACAETRLKLKIVSNRGTVVYPPTGAPTDCADHWRSRFVPRVAGEDLDFQDVLKLMGVVNETYRIMHMELLMEFDGERAYSLAQGEI